MRGVDTKVSHVSSGLKGGRVGGFGGLFGCRQWVAVTPEEKRCRPERPDMNDWCVTAEVEDSC